MKRIYVLFLSCLSIILFSDCEVNVSNKLGVLSYYTVTNTSPQTVGVGWTETVTAKDVYGNDVHVDLDMTLNLTSSTGNITFYTDGTYTTTTTSVVIKSGSGSTTIYLLDLADETVTITATDTNSKTGTSEEIEVYPEMTIVLDGVRDANYTEIALDPAGDLASPGPADWNGTWWCDITSMATTWDTHYLYVHVALPAYDMSNSTGQIGLVIEVDEVGVVSGSLRKDPWGNAIDFFYGHFTGFDAFCEPEYDYKYQPDYLIRGNIDGMNSIDNGWTELRKWDSDSATWDGEEVNWGGITNGSIGTWIAYRNNNGVEFAIPLSDIGNADPASGIYLEFFTTQGGSTKGSYDTVPSDDQSTGWDDPTVQDFLISTLGETWGGVTGTCP